MEGNDKEKISVTTDEEMYNPCVGKVKSIYVTIIVKNIEKI